MFEIFLLPERKIIRGAPSPPCTRPLILVCLWFQRRKLFPAPWNVLDQNNQLVIENKVCKTKNKNRFPRSSFTELVSTELVDSKGLQPAKRELELYILCTSILTWTYFAKWCVASCGNSWFQPPMWTVAAHFEEPCICSQMSGWSRCKTGIFCPLEKTW